MHILCNENMRVHKQYANFPLADSIYPLPPQEKPKNKNLRQVQAGNTSDLISRDRKQPAGPFLVSAVSAAVTPKRMANAPGKLGRSWLGPGY